MTTIWLNGGTMFDLDRMNCDALSIGTIAHALGNLCRFNGHTPHFYSVAEHCVHVSYRVSDVLAYQALMHDMAEAIIGDRIRPLKHGDWDFLALEARVEAALAARFAVPWPLARETIEADDHMLALELEVFAAMAAEGRDARTGPLEFLPPGIAAHRFLRRYHEVKP